MSQKHIDISFSKYSKLNQTVKIVFNDDISKHCNFKKLVNKYAEWIERKYAVRMTYRYYNDPLIGDRALGAYMLFHISNVIKHDDFRRGLDEEFIL